MTYALELLAVASDGPSSDVVARSPSTAYSFAMTASASSALPLLEDALLASENILRAADAVVVPLLPTPLSVRMLEQLLEFVARAGWPDLRLLPFFSMVDRRRSLHEEAIAAARAQFPGVLKTEVPYWSDIERMTVRRAPLPAFAPHSPAGQTYVALWREVQSRLPD